MNFDVPLTILVIILAAGGCLLVVGAVIVTLLVIRNRRMQDRQRDLQWQQVVHGTDTPTTPAIPNMEATCIETSPPENYTPSPNALAVLLITKSNDPTMPCRRIEITRPVTALGRKSDNDIIFARDSLVSRRHAIIDQRQAQLYLHEVISTDDDGNPKRPPFGTFVNGIQIQGPTPLKTGDEIQLGKSVSMRIESIRPLSVENDLTMDQVPDGNDTTMKDMGVPQG